MIQKANKNSVDTNDFSEQFSRFYEESSQISSNFDQKSNLAYVQKPDLQISSKIDEVKYLIAVKEREEQARNIEYQRNFEHMLAEKEIFRGLDQQVTAKRQNESFFKRQDQIYGLQLEERKRFMDKVVTDEKNRHRQVQQAYSSALHEQIRQKNQQEILIKQLENSRKAITPEPNDYSHSPYSVSPNQSHLKYLAQYGNFVVARKK